MASREITARMGEIASALEIAMRRHMGVLLLELFGSSIM
jgi:hypothetical protein